MDYRDREANLIKSLASLLHQNGEHILTGNSKLSLTTRCLSILNDCFTTISDDGDFLTSFEVPPPNSPRFPVMQDLQFLYDFVQKTYALKILHSTSTISGRINLTAFRALQTLEVKKIPLHLLQGLNKLRARLKVVICTRCLTNLMELLELCGGDMAAALTWPQLQTFSAAFNDIKELDNSLRLLPALTILDLSHNLIQETENYLQHLTELQTLNLSYNRLASVPTFSISGRKSLHTLSLRSNNLSSLAGLQELVNLRDIDLSENCLSNHQCLEALKPLHLLCTLHLVGNPIYYHKKHRLLSLEYVNNSVLSKLKLDGKLVTQAEIMHVKKSKNSSVNNIINTQMPMMDDLRPLMVESRSFASISSVGDTGSLAEETDIASGIRAKAKNRRKGKISARKVDVPDATADGDSSPDLSQTSTPTQTSEHLSFKEHIENVRQHLGHDWLQTMNLPRKVTAKVIAGKVVNASEDDLYLKDADLEPIVHTKEPQVFEDVGPENDANANQDSDIDISEAVEREIKVAKPQPKLNRDYGLPPRPIRTSSTSSEKAGLKQDAKDAKDANDAKHVISQEDGQKGTQLLANVPSEEGYDSANQFSDSYYTPDTSMSQKLETEYESYSSDNPFASDLKTEKSESVLLSSDAYDDTNPFAADMRADRNFTRQSSEQESEFSWGMNKSDTGVDLGPESDPFIVTFPEDDEDEFIVVLTDNYLVEKDLNGSVIETLDLKTLLMIQDISQQMNGTDIYQTKKEKSPPVLRLTFDYVRKDRRERRYVMEDEQNAKAFIELMNPILKAAQEARALRNQLHCLKCGSDFSKDAANRQLPSNTATSGTYTGLAGTIETGHLEEELNCPFCNSTMLIEQDPHHQEKRVATTGSFSSFPLRNINPLSASELSSSVKSTSTAYSSAMGTPVMALKALDIDAYIGKPSSHSEVTFQLGGESLPKFQEGMKEAGDINENTLKSDSPVDRVFNELETRAMKRVGSLENKAYNRKDSVDSDITVLSRQTSAVSYTDSDIAVISRNSLTDSREVTPVKVSGLYASEPATNGLSQSNPKSETPTDGDQLSPIGSLTNKTLNSMIETVYEKSIYEKTLKGLKNNSSTSLASLASTGTHSSLEHHPVAVIGQDGSYSMREKGKIEYWYDDFSRIDHRLKLHLSMSVFGEDEEFKLLLRCGIVPFTSGAEFPGLLVVSSKSLYVFRIKCENSDDQPETWLKQQTSQPLSSLCYVDIGLGYQSFRVEFGSESSCFTFVVRDDTWCKRYITQFTEIMQDTAFSSHGKLKGITKNNPKTVASLENQVLMLGTSEDGGSDVEVTLLKYCLAYQHTGEKSNEGKDALSSVSVAVTPSHICLATEDHRFPVPRCRPSELEGQQFHLKDKQRITDITQLVLEICVLNPGQQTDSCPEVHWCTAGQIVSIGGPMEACCLGDDRAVVFCMTWDLYCQDRQTVTIHFSDEETLEECQWKLTMETEQSLQSLVDAIRQPWEAQFGVQLLLNSEIV